MQSAPRGWRRRCPEGQTLRVSAEPSPGTGLRGHAACERNSLEWSSAARFLKAVC